MRRVAVVTASRSERGLLEPIIRRLQERIDIEFRLIEDWDRWWKAPDQGEWLPDVALIPADRREMVPVATALYYAGIPFFHLWAGAAYTGTWDDLNRRVISTFSYLMLCEDKASRRRLIDSGEEPWRCIVTGTPHFDDLQVDVSIFTNQAFRTWPRTPPIHKLYDLVLLKPNPVDKQDERDTVTRTLGMLDFKVPNVWIGPADPFDELVIPPWTTHFPDLPRPQFLALLQNCRRFISNSSATVYEAPFFHVRVVNPGKRNKDKKTSAELKHGAADRIVDLLVNYPLDKAKLLKPYGRR